LMFRRLLGTLYQRAAQAPHNHTSLTNNPSTTHFLYSPCCSVPGLCCT
jgi:hypothetical protein